MTLSQFLYILRARWKVGLLILVTTVGLAMGASLLLPKRYTATAMLVVDQTRPDPVAGSAYTGNPSPAFMATQVDVLKSDRVAFNVVRQLGLANDATLRELWMQETRGEGGLENWLVERVPWRRSLPRLLARHRARLVTSGAMIVPFNTEPLEDFNAVQRELDVVNTELGFLNPQAQREDLGKFTHEGRYRVWKEIWMLNYLGRSVRYY